MEEITIQLVVRSTSDKNTILTLKNFQHGIKQLLSAFTTLEYVSMKEENTPDRFSVSDPRNVPSDFM
jgi:hypothetical protein